MTPEVAARAFDPFFTTKPPGQGTGLGLSQVYGFVRQTGGHVRIDTEPGHGTSVKIYLPRSIAEAQPAALRTEDGPPAAGGRSEIILVVEDDDSVRRLSVEALTELGYRVLEAPGGAVALSILDGQPVDLLFTDLVMPDMNGRTLADEAIRRRPALKILFTTGYTRDAVAHDGMPDPGIRVVAKPFTLEQLASKVRETLDAG
jgi:CheY-like chemotaxis protein